MSYSLAHTAADLYTVPPNVTQAFTKFLSIPVDTKGHPIFNTYFHTVYGPWQPPAFGPANDLVYRFVGNTLQIGGFNSVNSQELGYPLQYSNTSASWSNGVTIRRLDETITKDGITANVWNIQTKDRNVYVTPVSF